MRHATRLLAVWVVGVVTGLPLGGGTSFGQQHLPDGLRSFANSNGGWALLAFVVVLGTRWRDTRRWWVAAVLGLLVFHAFLQGYAVVSTLSGFPDSYGPGVSFFSAATLAGPLLGLAGLWWSVRSIRRAIGIALFESVMIGDGISSLVQVSSITGWL